MPYFRLQICYNRIKQATCDSPTAHPSAFFALTQLPAYGYTADVQHSLQIQLTRLASDRWARRGVRLLLKASSFALSLLCVILGLHLWFGWTPRWTWLMALALGCIALGALLVLRPRMKTQEVARRLDRRFGLNEQLMTALEVGPQAEGVGAYLYEQSRRNLAQIRRQVLVHQRFPWLDLALVLTLLLLLGGMLALTGIETAPSDGTAEPLPSLLTPPDSAANVPDEPVPPTATSQPTPGSAPASGSGLGDPAAASALANALRDQSVTRPAAEALDRGDAAGAAQSLRDLASQAGGLSDQARAALAQSLRNAANQIAQTNPALAEQVRASAEGLAPTNPDPAQALQGLADAVQQLGQGQGAGQDQAANQAQPGQNGGGAGQGSLPGQQREQSSERLGVDGVPLELASDGPGHVPTTGEPQGQATAGDGTGATSGGGFSQSGVPVQVADDPLRIPADLRDVVQGYFSP